MTYCSVVLPKPIELSVSLIYSLHEYGYHYHFQQLCQVSFTGACGQLRANFGGQYVCLFLILKLNE